MKYIFRGKVYPETISLTLPEAHGNLGADDVPFKGTVKASVSNSEVYAELETDSKFPIVDFKNTVEAFVNAMADIYGYVKGRSYLVEINSVDIPETGYNQVFENDVVEIANDEKNRPLSYQDTFQLAFSTPGFYMVFKDLRDAMRKPHDTYFHCRRATETIAKHFTNSNNQAKGWEDMIRNLKIDKDDLDLIRNEGGTQRHGEYRSETGDKRVEIMMKTWKVVDKFIEYLHNQGK